MPDNSNENIKKEKNISFFKRILMSIKDFDKYYIFAKEKIGRSIIYIAKIMAVFAIVITAISMLNFFESITKAEKWFETNISEIKYTDGTISINNDEKTETEDFKKLLGKVIIDTKELTEDQIVEYKDSISEETSSIIFLKNKVLIKNSVDSDFTEMEYKTLFETFNITEVSKDSIVNYYKNNLVSIYASTAIQIFGMMFALYIIEVCFYSLILAILGCVIARIIGMKLKIDAAYSMSIYAFTLPTLLNILYVIINAITGFSIKYFDVMYIGIAFVYVITAIFMIKTDFMKDQLEVQKIEDEQKRISEDMKNKDAEEREKQKEKEKEEQENTEKPGKNKEKSKKPLPKIGDKPEGDNA